MWGIYLKSYEKEAFIKSFLLFFFVQLLFLSIIMWQYHKSVTHRFDMKIMHEMTQCSYTLTCSKYHMSFIRNLERRELNSFYKSGDDYYMIFSIPNTTEYFIKLSFAKSEYEQIYYQILLDNLGKYLIYLFIVVIISTFFAHFALRPLRKALRLNDEFVKDMLHDFNTPLSSLKINFKLLEKKFGQDDAMVRSKEAMQTIDSLQSNLTYFLSHSPLVEEKLDLNTSIYQRLQTYKTIFPDIKFFIDIDSVFLKTNPEAFMRVVDNLLSNAAKYNVKGGVVHIFMEGNFLVIEDSGIGIKHPSKIFDRFYKETSRGMGIGLHVVKKLCDDLGVEIKVESYIDRGTKFLLNVEKVMIR